jgi:hypothetical protein
MSRRFRWIGLVALVIVAARTTGAGGQALVVGTVAFPNSGAPTAQTAFLTGLAQLHNFEYDSAATFFREAERADPGFAMAYWGEAMTFNHAVWMQQDRAAALAALAKLGPTREARLSKAPTAREKDYLGAAEILYGAGEKYARDFAYADAMAALHTKYPDDPDAATFYALSLLGTAHEGRDFATYMRAAAVLEPVFKDYPDHPGAAHYLIHSYDDPIHAPLGLRAARAYSKIAPDAGHAQHMTSHIFVATGMWDDVVAANESAVRVVDQGRAKRGLKPSACGHYNFWLEYGYLEQGRLAAAKKLVADCYAPAGGGAATRPPGQPALDPDASSVGSFATMRARYLIDSEEWRGDVASWTVPAFGQPSAIVTIEFGTGYAAMKSGEVDKARSALARLSAAKKTLDADLAKRPTSDQSYGARAKILESQLAAVIQTASGGAAEAITAMRAVAASESKMPFEFGPPLIDKPSFELLGELLLASDRAADARAAFEESLARTPERTASLSGLMRAATKLGDAAKAAAIDAKLKSIWKR